LVSVQRSDGVFLLETDGLFEGLQYALDRAELNDDLKHPWKKFLTNGPV
jgi:hypothetical protein